MVPYVHNVAVDQSSVKVLILKCADARCILHMGSKLLTEMVHDEYPVLNRPVYAVRQPSKTFYPVAGAYPRTDN